MARDYAQWKGKLAEKRTVLAGLLQISADGCVEFGAALCRTADELNGLTRSYIDAARAIREQSIKLSATAAAVRDAGPQLGALVDAALDHRAAHVDPTCDLCVAVDTWVAVLEEADVG